MADYTIKEGDTQAIGATLTEGGAAVNLTNASVRFHMEEPNGTLVVDAPATVTNAVGGVVEYVPAPGDVDTPGTHLVEWEVTYGDGSVETFPADDHLELEIVRELS